MTRPIILSTQPLDAYAEQKLGQCAEFRIVNEPSEAGMLAEAADAIAFVIRGQVPVTPHLMDAAPKLKVIGRTGVGYETVDIPAATARGIPVVNAPGAGARAVAEAAITFMLSLCKLVAHWDHETKRGNWNSRIGGKQAGDLDGKTLGIIGLGRIGQIVAKLARPFEMNIIARDPYLDPKIAQNLGVNLVSLDEVMSQSDFITLHCPQNEETMGMIDRPLLNKVKPGSYFINLARGGIVESLDPLHEMLVSGQLTGVALDVFAIEPPDHTHPIFRDENFLCSPHALATSDGAMRRIFKSMADDMAAILEGKSPQFVVNPEVLVK